MRTVEKAISMELTFSVLNTSYAVVKLRPEKKIRSAQDFNPLTMR